MESCDFLKKSVHLSQNFYIHPPLKKTRTNLILTRFKWNSQGVYPQVLATGCASFKTVCRLHKELGIFKERHVFDQNPPY